MLAFTASLFLFLGLVTGSIAVVASGRGRKSLDQRVQRLRTGGGEAGARLATASLKRGYSSLPTLQHLLNQSEWADEVAGQLRQANVHLRVGEYLLVRLLVGGVLFLFSVLLSRMHPLGILIGLGIGVVGFVIPGLLVGLMRRRRVAAIQRQLVDFLPMLSSSLRSGFAVLQGIELAARQVGPPLGDELLLLINDLNLGATMETALQDLGKRVGSTDLDMMNTAIMVQRTTGGNLSEVLEQAAETLRERERIRGDVATLTASQRLTGIILSAYPIAVGLLLLAIMPSMWSVLFTDPLGRMLLGVALGLQVLGFLVMRRVMEIEI